MYNFLEDLPRPIKRFILLGLDILLIPLCLLLAFSLRHGHFIPREAVSDSWVLFPLLMAFGVIASYGLGLPKIKLAAFETRAIARTGVFALFLSILAIGLSYLLALGTPRSVPIIFGVLLFLAGIGSRIGGLYLLNYLHDRQNDRRPVAIYGAGAAGIQLVSALRQSHEVRPLLFVDDNIALQGLIIAGLPVHPPRKLDSLSETGKIESVLLAIPSAELARQRAIVRELQHLDCEVQTLPSYIDMIAGKGLVDGLHPVSADDLLGRDKVDLNIPGVTEAYSGKSILVSGAGGSIGSELCRQVLSCAPGKLVLYEHSEFNLYTIDQELRPLAEEAGVELVTILGSVCDAPRVNWTIQTHDVEIILHAAAYKHVPLVENNELEGLRNNVLGTKTLADAAKKHGLERFILISTDKAVRPTNVMGASKRLAELLVQDLASRPGSTLFSMVRFGNVLGSSGSVIPLFQAQIAKGGPVTLTHSDVTRYFMTIPEAARLVLIAGSFSRGGDVFVLDMGKPIHIKELARRMIELSGRTIRNGENPNGDIEITTTGLRPGEKLYEELLIGGDMLTTPHGKILRAQEKMLSELEIANTLKDLQLAIQTNDAESGRAVIERWVEGYHRPEQTSAG